MMWYRRTQIGWPLISILGVVLVLTLWRANLVVDAATPLILITAVVLVLFATLTVSLTDQHLQVRFGIGVVRRQFALASLRSWERTRNPWWWGYGIRYYPGGTLYNASGTSAVELTFDDGRRVRIGTDDPDGLVAALNQVSGTRSPLTAEGENAIRFQAARIGFRRRVFVVALLVLVAGTCYIHLQPPTILVSDESVSVRSGWYVAEIPFGEISSVSLEDELPGIERRTNGFAFSGRLRGSFRVTGLGRGQLFVNRRNPPFVVIRRARGFVIVNYADAAETGRLYETLTTASRRLRTGR